MRGRRWSAGSRGKQIRLLGMGDGNNGSRSTSGLGRGLAEEPAHHHGVLDRIGPVVVVEGDEDALRLVGHRLDFWQKRSQLAIRVEIVVLLAHGGPLPADLAKPPLRVATV